MALEREILLLGVLNQLDLSGEIYYKILARDIGAPSPGAAAVHWSRFHTKLRNSAAGGGSPAKPTGIQKSPQASAKVAKMGKGGIRVGPDEEGGRMDADDELVGMLELPVRRMPARKSRAVASYFSKHEPTDEEWEEEEHEKEGCDEVLEMPDVEDKTGSSGDQSLE